MGFNSFLKKIFGDKSSRDMKAIQPFVEQVKEAYPAIKELNNDELRAKTQEIRQQVLDSAKEERAKVAELKAKIEETPIDERAEIFKEIDKIEKEILEIYEKALNDVMPVAFSIVKDTARRFAENEETVVTATEFDRELALNPNNDFISIDGDKAIYHNHWTAGGNDLKWEMVHYDVQLFGGVVLHQGKIAEMATGEGKTLVATLPVFLNALTGNGVHVVTVNDYLAKRDSEWMGPLYMFHGLSVDCIDKHQPNSAARRKAYQADITFGTNNEFGFDYLRDNMAMSPDDLVQRAHNYAIVDEVDSVLIDDARTPLIISGPTPGGEDQMYEEYQPLVEKLVGVQRKLATQLLAEAREKITEGQKKNDKKLTEEGFLALFRSYKCMPKNKALIKYLSEEGIKTGMLQTEEYYMQNNNREMPKAVAPLYFVVDEKINSCDLTDKGTDWLAKEVGNDELFVLPDITSMMSELEADTTLSDEERVEKKDELLAHYGKQSERVHTLQQLLKAYTMFFKDDEYVIVDGEVKIVDAGTGRIMEGRRWSDGLHQAVEAKEHVKVEAATQTFATITLQNYFRMYHKLAGMTGTAITEAGEFWDIYKLDVVEIPTNKPVIRKDMDDRIYKTQREKYRAVIDEIVEMRNSGRPCLVGTTSVEISELLSKMLKMRNIPHNVLNAKLHQREADIVAEAGRSTDGLGAVTIATNMAGRGTDIKLTDEVKEAGGLAIIGTERHESRRVDRQLRGRAGRQGDPGSSVFYVSLEDKLMRMFGSERISKVMDMLGFEDGERIEHSRITKSIESAQKKVEVNHFGVRKHLLDYDDVMNRQRTVIYEKRRHALMGERIGMDIADIIYNRIEHFVNDSQNYQECKEHFIRTMAMKCPFTEEQFLNAKKQQLIDNAYDLAIADFTKLTDEIQRLVWEKMQEIVDRDGFAYERILIPITDGKKVYNIPCDFKEAYDTEGKSVVKQFEKVILLHFIDDNWKEHLRLMDELRHSVHNVSYEQKDPLLIYKIESSQMWDTMINELYDTVAAILMRGKININEEASNVREAAPEQRQTPQYTTNRGAVEAAEREMQDQAMAAAAHHDTRENQQANQPRIPIIKNKMPGRNDPCFCGSGKKFKNCHGRGM
ncbi:MAG: preprotein translocase subunit SecA [Prevotella sp.]|nr:preprotein translocase subunit SecA [Prevotella sp.]